MEVRTIVTISDHRDSERATVWIEGDSIPTLPSKNELFRHKNHKGESHYYRVDSFEWSFQASSPSLLFCHILLRPDSKSPYRDL